MPPPAPAPGGGAGSGDTSSTSTLPPSTAFAAGLAGGLAVAGIAAGAWWWSARRRPFPPPSHPRGKASPRTRGGFRGGDSGSTPNGRGPHRRGLDRSLSPPRFWTPDPAAATTTNGRGGGRGYEEAAAWRGGGGEQQAAPPRWGPPPPHPPPHPPSSDGAAPPPAAAAPAGRSSDGGWGWGGGGPLPTPPGSAAPRGHARATPTAHPPSPASIAAAAAAAAAPSPSSAGPAGAYPPTALGGAGPAPSAATLVPPPLPPSLLRPPPAPAPADASAGALAAEGRIIEDAATAERYCRVITPEPAASEETEEVCLLLAECVGLRERWLFQPATPPSADPDAPEAAAPSDTWGERGRGPFDWTPADAALAAGADGAAGAWEVRMVDGVFTVFPRHQAAASPTPPTPSRPEPPAAAPLFAPPGSATDFFTDMHRVLKVAAAGPVKTFAHRRLALLEQKFALHCHLNADKECLAQKSAPHRDFYNVRKVDTHVHHSACMHQKHLLRFIKAKLRKEPGEVVIFRDGKYLTLAEVFESLRLTAHELNVDTLDMHADRNTFHRFDRFNLKYNPFGQSRLREVFIKQDNLIRGRFLAELTKEVFADLEASKYQHAEYRVSVYGRKRVEWATLAAWVAQHGLYSDNVVWLIQIPRLYDVYKAQGIVDSFAALIDNIFGPLFEATLDPGAHPQLHLFLKHVVGFDMVDDESKPERRPAKHMPSPEQWDLKHNPAYAYYAYYVHANLYTLNKLREARGLNAFAFRPHAGEAGDVDHLVAGFLLAENIAHGIGLRKSPPLQFLFYLAQVGLCMSPLSNNSLFLDYHRNPFPLFFARGLSVSLSTDDPLQIHLTKEPLVEEYSVAAQVWKLSAADLCEVARNSVLHSGFPHACKRHWVGGRYWEAGPAGNDIQKTNVPNLRVRFRVDCLWEERAAVDAGAGAASARAARAAAARVAREAREALMVH